VKRVRWVVLGLLVWLALSVPVGILVGKVLKASREEAERQGLRALQERQEQRERQAPLDRWGQPVSKDNPVHPVRSAHLGPRDHKGKLVCKEHPEPPVP
jgi:hypothetical protein